MKPLSKLERELIARLRDLETRVSVIEALPTPIVFAIGKFPEPVLMADCQPPSQLEH